MDDPAVVGTWTVVGLAVFMVIAAIVFFVQVLTRK